MSDTLKALLALYFGQDHAAVHFATPLIGSSGGIGEFVLAKVNLYGKALPRSEEIANDLFRQSADQGYFRGFLELGFLKMQFGVSAAVPTIEEERWNSAGWLFAQSYSIASELHRKAHSADAADFLGWWHCEFAYIAQKIGLPGNRSDGLELLTEAFNAGFESTASYLARTTYSISDESVSNQWLERFVAAQQSFITSLLSSALQSTLDGCPHNPRL